MSYENPTPLRIGAMGTLNGWRVRVAGRVVMGMEDGGATYYWNEFNLVDESGNSATLVYEETETGAEWKLFRDFTPSQPITVAEAPTKRVGDTVTLDGTPARITLVDQSRVYHIEGVGPEGVEVGDVANYFNVDTGSRMLVVSWTGNEIEFYEGLDAPAESVADAFNIPRDAAPGTASFRAAPTAVAGTGQSTSSRTVARIVIVALIAVFLFATYSCFSGRSSSKQVSAPRPKQAAPALRLPTGVRGSLAQHTYVVDAHALVEIARVAGRHDRREYQLRDEADRAAVLVNGLSGGSREWHLFTPAPVPAGLTPFDAAMKRKGAPLNIDGRTLPITDLFRSTVTSADLDAGQALAGSVQYGFVAHDAGDWLIARWTETEIQFLLGKAVSDAEVLAALNHPAAKSK